MPSTSALSVPKVKVEEFAKYIQNKSDLYEACLRNDWYLPKYKSSMVTEAYLKNVMIGKTWCPRYSELKPKPCPRPPYKQILIDKFLAAATDKGYQSIGMDEDHLPDKRWLLDVLAKLTPDDEIFRKNYLPPPKKSKLSEIEAIELPANFLADLPLSKSKVKRKGLKTITDGNKLAKIEALKMRQKEIADRIIVEEMKKEESGKKGSALQTQSFKKKSKEEEKQHPAKSPNSKQGASAGTRANNKGTNQHPKGQTGDKDHLMSG